MLKYTITQKNKARGDSTWYGRIFDTDTKDVRFVSLGTNLKRLADEWLRKKITEEMTGKKDDANVSISTAIDKFVSTYTNQVVKNSYTFILVHVKVYAAENGIDKVVDLSPTDCVNIFAGLTTQKASTRRVMLTRCKTWWRWCEKAYRFKLENPFAIVKVEKPEPADRSFWTTEQLQAILEATTDREDRLLNALMCYAGLRIHEAVKIRGEDIHDGKIHVVGKGKKFAVVPVSNRLQAELDRFGELPDGKILRRSSPNGYNRKLSNFFASHPELDFGGKVHPHRFRHSFASNLVRAGIGLPIVMRLMRHSNINMTMIYAHLMPDDLSKAINVI